MYSWILAPTHLISTMHPSHPPFHFGSRDQKCKDECNGCTVNLKCKDSRLYLGGFPVNWKSVSLTHNNNMKMTGSCGGRFWSRPTSFFHTALYRDNNVQYGRRKTVEIKILLPIPIISYSISLPNFIGLTSDLEKESQSRSNCLSFEPRLARHRNTVKHIRLRYLVFRSLEESPRFQSRSQPPVSVGRAGF